MNYSEELALTIEYWCKEPNKDEWYFVNFRRRHIDSMSPDRAFSAIDETISFLIKDLDESTSIEVLQTILDLAKHSQTTEKPEKLIHNLDYLENIFAAFGTYAQTKFAELKQYYRLSS